jgi:hypothetical protein
MVNTPKPKDLADAADISAGYASMILNGKRPVPNHVALVAFRQFGLRLGFLSMLGDADIEKLCAERDAVADPSKAAITPDALGGEDNKIVNTILRDAA